MQDSTIKTIVIGVFIAVVGGVITAWLIRDARFAEVKPEGPTAADPGEERTEPRIGGGSKHTKPPTTPPVQEPPKKGRAGADCGGASACEAPYRCIRDVCGVTLMRAGGSCKRRCVLHTNSVDSSSSAYPVDTCHLKPGHLVVVLAVGDRTKPENWPVYVLAPPSGCPTRAYMHPSVMEAAD